MSRPDPTQRRRVVIAGALLALATLAVYAPVAGYPFIDYDDAGYVFGNEIVSRGLTLEGLSWALTTGQQSNWHPLTWWSHMLDVELFGVDGPGGHHAVNVILHLANSLLLWLLLARASGATWRPAFCAAVFALHPLHVESVAWVSERKDVLSACFGLLCLLAWVRYARSRGLRWYGASLLLLGCGLLAKPMLVTLPFVLLLLDAWPLGRDRGAEPDAAVWRRLISEKLPLFVVAALSAGVTYLVQQQGGAVVHDQSLAHRLSTAVIGYALYLDKLVRPIHLALLYPNHEGMWRAWQVIAAVALLAGVSALAWRFRRRRYPVVGWLWFLGMLVPVIGIVQFGRQVVADRYMYLPMVGLLIVVAWGGHDLLGGSDRGRRALAALAGLAILGCLVLTPLQVRRWRDSETLFRHALAVTERNDVMHQTLAGVLHARGDVADAVEHYRAGLAINPNNPDAHYNLAGALNQLGRTAEAIEQYQAALAIDRDHRDAHNNLAGLLAAGGRVEEALFHYREALRIDRDYGLGHFNLAGALIGSGRVREAIGHYREALRIDPDFVAAHSNLALVLARSGDLDGAERHFRQVLRLRPNDEAARAGLARIDALRRRGS